MRGFTIVRKQMFVRTMFRLRFPGMHNFDHSAECNHAGMTAAGVQTSEPNR